MLIGHWLSNVKICNMFIIYSYVIVILKAQCIIVCFQGWFCCVYLREIKNPILVLLYLGKSPSPPVYFIGSQRVSYLWTNITYGQTIWRPGGKFVNLDIFTSSSNQHPELCSHNHQCVTVLCYQWANRDMDIRHLYKLSGHTIVLRNISSQHTVSIIE